MSKTKPKPKLPKAGDSSPAAVGIRLQYGRVSRGSLKVEEIAKRLNVTPAKYRDWEAGKQMIPPRQLWLYSFHVWGPREWLLTGSTTPRVVPDVLPTLGDDLGGFAARMKEARVAAGFKISEAIEPNGLFRPQDWQKWESGEDEPRYEAAVAVLDWLEVSAEWLYTDTGATQSRPAKRMGRFVPDTWQGEQSHGIGARMKQAREAAGLSLKDASLFAGPFISATDLRRIESDKEPPPTCQKNLQEHLMALAALYGVSLEWLLYGPAELTILRRRVERLRRRFGLPGPSRKADAA